MGDRGYVDYAYDAALRLTKINDQNNEDTVFVLDDASRRTSITKGTEVDTFTYEPWGGIATANRGTSANPDLVSAVTRSYDVLKRDGTQLADYDYVGNRMSAQTYETGGNDVVLTNAYDGAARLTRMTYAQTGNTGLPDYSYAFDAASNITQKTFEQRSGDPSEDYLYDTLHRLTRTTFGQRTSDPYKGWTYDDLGNHLSQDDDGTTTAGLFNATNEQTKRGTTQVYYDKRGNLTKDDNAQEYFYDRDNKLTRIEDGSSNRIASYAYDALGRRIEKDVEDAGGDIVTRFYWTPGNQLLEEADDAGTPDVLRYYVWTPSGGYIDELVLFVDSTGSDTDYFVCRNHNYNVTALLDNAGVVVERYDYNPYGERFVLDADYSDDADGVSDVGNPVGHQGLYHDEETGLVYNRARMLNSMLGRFMKRDPLKYSASLNLYEYLNSQLFALLDPNGQEPCCERRSVKECCDDYLQQNRSILQYLRYSHML